MKKEMNSLQEYTQIKREVMTSLSEEVEQITWVFRNSGDFMSHEKMLKLEADIQRYNNTLGKLKDAEAIVITPVDPRKVLKTILPSK